MLRPDEEHAFIEWLKRHAPMTFDCYIRLWRTHPKDDPEGISSEEQHA